MRYPIVMILVFAFAVSSALNIGVTAPGQQAPTRPPPVTNTPTPMRQEAPEQIFGSPSLTTEVKPVSTAVPSLPEGLEEIFTDQKIICKQPLLIIGDSLHRFEYLFLGQNRCQPRKSIESRQQQ